jgi:hypothetical protein
MEISETNSGDHRVRIATGPGGSPGESERETVGVPAVRLDDEIAARQVALLWVDAQGHEAHVLSGAQDLLATDTPVVIEYWPYGLRRADGLERLETLISRHFATILDTSQRDDGRPRAFKASDVSDLRDRYSGPGDYTDLLLLSD